MNKNQNGFSIVEFLIAIIIMALVGSVGFYVFNNKKTSDSTVDPPKQTVQKTQSNSILEFEDGLRLQPKDFGVDAGKPVADVSAIQLADKTWRIYAFAQDKGILSAISKDGLSFTAESGARLGDGSGMPRVLKLSNGKIRMYFIDGGGVKSAISDDGLNFTKEAGMRITAPSGVDATTGISTPVKMSDGKWHTYFSELPRPGEGLKSFSVYTAVSSDLVNWTVSKDVALGGGKLVSTAEHPDAVLNSKGEVVLYFFVNKTRKLMTATSTDGVKFSSAKETGLDCNDPNIVMVTSSKYRIYCGDFDPQTGGIVKSALVTNLL